MNAFQLTFIPYCGLMACVVLARMARGRISKRSGLAWLIVWLTAAFFIANPSRATQVAMWVGVARGADLVFYLAVLGALAAGLAFYNQHRRLEALVTEALRRETLRDSQFGLVPTPTDIPQNGFEAGSDQVIKDSI